MNNWAGIKKYGATGDETEDHETFETPEAVLAFSEKGFSSLLSDVMILKIPHVSGSLQQLLKLIEKADINVEYMYGLSIDKAEAYVVLKSSNFAKTEEVLKANGVETISPEQLINM